MGKVLFVVIVCFCSLACADEDTTGNFSRSASFSKGRQLERLFNNVRTYASLEEYGNAASVLNEILSKHPPETFVEHRGVIHHASALANHLLSSLPEEVLDAYERVASEAAELALNQAFFRQDHKKLHAVAARYRGTYAGAEALEYLISLMLDQGNLRAANKYFLALKQSPRGRNLDLISQQISTFREGKIDEQLQLESELTSQWESPPELKPQTHALIRESLFDLREHGLNPLTTHTALDVDNDVLIGTPLDLRRVAPESGEVIWKRPYHGYGIQKFREITDFSDSNRKRLFTETILHRIYGEATYRSVSSSSGKLYVVERDKLNVLNDQPGRQKVFPTNKIVCLDSHTGQSLWEFDGGKFAPFFFGAAPTVDGDQLYVQGESKKGAILLLVIDAANGDLLRSTTLAQSQFPLDSDKRRHSQNCPVVITDDHRVFCPMGTGTVAMVDPLWGEVFWARRYARNDANVSGPGMGQPEVGSLGYQWWNGWQTVSATIAANTLVMTSPESNQVTAYHEKTGKTRWSKSRGSDLFVAHVDPQLGVIIVGKNSIKALNLESGKTRWESDLPTPAGYGVLAGHEYVLPTNAAGFSRIDLLTGDVQTPDADWRSFQHDTLTSDLRSRNLCKTKSGYYEVGADSVRKLTINEPQRTKRKPLIATSPSLVDLATAARRGELPAVYEAVKHVLAHEETGRDSSLRREVAELVIRMLPSLDEAEDFSVLSETVAELLDEKWDLANWKQRQLAVSLDTHSWQQMINIFLAGDPDVWNQRVPSQRGETRVRIQECFFGALQDVVHTLDESKRAELQQLLVDAAQQSEGARDRVLHLMNSLEWQTDLPVKDSNAKPNSPLIVLKPWPNRNPAQTIKPRQFVNIANQIPVRAARGSLFSRLNIDLDYPSPRGVIFSSGQHRHWNCGFPNVTSNLRHERDLMHAWGFDNHLVLQVGSEVYGIRPFDQKGRRSATRVWPKIGKPSIDTLGTRSKLMLSFQRDRPIERPGFSRSPVQRVDEFGHYSTSVGPVNDRYFVIQQKGMLVLSDTHSGEEIWRRFDLPERAICFGNSKELTVISTTTNHQQVIRVVDGKLLRTTHLPISADSIILRQGTKAIIANGDPTRFDASIDFDMNQESPMNTDSMTLTCLDLISHEQTWKRGFPGGAIPFEVDQEWMGVLTSVDAETGKIQLLNRSNGETVIEHQLDMPKQVTRIACSLATDSFLLAISTAIDDEHLSSAKQRFQGLRRPMINGRLYNVARETGEIIWGIDFPNTILPLDQPVDLPIFITAESRYPDERMDKGTPGSLLRCYDRRTGEIIYENESLSPTLTQYGIVARRSREEIILNTQTIQVEFDYSDPALQEAPEDKPDNK